MNTSNSLIISSDSISIGERLRGRPRHSDTNVALVLVSEQNKLGLGPNDRITPGEWRYGGYHTVYKVDISQFPINLECAAPSVEGIYSFACQLVLECRVIDAVGIVERQSMSIDKDIQVRIEDLVRITGRRFAAQDSTGFENTLRTELSDRDLSNGISASITYLQITSDPRVTRVAIANDDIQTTHMISQLQHRVDMEGDRQKQERMQQGIDFFRSMVGNNLLAYYLNQNPDDINTILQIIGKEQGAERDMRRELMKGLIDKSDLMSYEVIEIIQKLGFTENQHASPELENNTKSLNDEPDEW